MKIFSTVSLFPDSKESQNLFTLLQSEGKETPRCTIAITQYKDEVRLAITAKDATAFRSQMNVLSQLFSLYENTQTIT